MREKERCGIYLHDRLEEPIQPQPPQILCKSPNQSPNSNSNINFHIESTILITQQSPRARSIRETVKTQNPSIHSARSSETFPVAHEHL